jgi:hypothetical protein
VGSGQQRYKFMDQTEAIHSMHSLVSQGQGHDATRSVHPTAPLSNELSTLRNQLTFFMGVTDPRFDLTVYGYFLEGIPSRLGRNPALDASVQTLTVAFSIRLNGPSNLTRADVLQSYNETLRCLRGCLNDPVSAHTPETMCAVYLTMVCQGWIGRRGDFLPSHGSAIALLLNAAIDSDSLDRTSAFETGMVATLGTIVVCTYAPASVLPQTMSRSLLTVLSLFLLQTLESFVNPKLELDPRVLTFPRPTGPHTTVQDALNIKSLGLGALTTTAQLIKVAYTSGAKISNEHLSQIRWAYEQTQNDCVTIKAALSQAPWQQPAPPNTDPSTVTPPSPPSVSKTRLHVRMQSCYGVLLTLSLMLGSVLQGADEQDDLVDRANTDVDEVIQLAQEAERYRPLGSSGTPMYLIAAWSVTNGAERQAGLERLIGNYQTDFPSANWLAVAYMLKPRLSKSDVTV